MSASSTVDTVTDSASDLAHRAQEFANDTVIPALVAAAAQLQQSANNTVIPALQSAATTVADSAREHGQDLLERLAETDQAQELARRATLVAAGSEGAAPKRWPLLAAGLGLGVLIGALVGRRTATTPPPAAVAPASTASDATT